MRVAEPKASLVSHLEGIQQDKYVIPRCGSCGKVSHPLDMTCEACGATAFDMISVQGRGRVYSFIAMRRPEMTAASSPIAALVDLEEGVRVATNLVDVEFAEIEFGMEVELEFRQTQTGKRIPVFKPVD